jgi:sugar-specific transcriptional regulator TrmB
MLQKFGFPQYESKVYEVLVSSEDPMNTTEIVKYSGVPKAKIYEVLSRMIEKGIILDCISEKNKLYTALPLSLVIEKLNAEFQSNIEQLKKNMIKKSYTDDRVWSLKDEYSIRIQSKQLIEQAKNTILVSGWNNSFSEYLSLLEKKEEEGANVEILVVGEMNINVSKVHTLIPAKEHNTLERFQLIIIDDREVIFTGVEENSWQAIKTMSKPFVKIFTEFFYHDVALTTINEKYHDLLMNEPEIRDILMKLRY